jgi:hypothetical protein
MAITLTKVNPAVVSGPPMATVSLLVTNTTGVWKAGQLLTVSSGALVPCASDAVDIKYFALTDQADPGNATTLAEVGVIDPDHVFMMNELNGAVTVANIGARYALDVTFNVCTVDVDDTGHDAFIVKDVMSAVEPINNKSDDVNGRLLVSILSSVIEA